MKTPVATLIKTSWWDVWCHGYLVECAGFRSRWHARNHTFRTSDWIAPDGSEVTRATHDVWHYHLDTEVVRLLKETSTAARKARAYNKKMFWGTW